MALRQEPMCFDFVPKYRVLPVNGRFIVGRRIHGFEHSYDAVEDHTVERIAAERVRTLNAHWEQKTT